MSIKKNYLYNIVSQITSIALSFLITPFLSRTIGAEGIGTYSYIQANVAYFVVLSKLGIETYGKREIARIRDENEKISIIFLELQVIHTVMSIASIILFFFSFGRSEKYYYIGYIIIIANCFDIVWFYQAIEQFKLLSFYSCVGRILAFVLSIIFIRDRNDLVIYFLIEAFILLFSNVFLWINLNKIIKFKLITNINCKRHINQLIIYFVPSISAVIFTLLDKTLINYFTGSSFENGYYDQAYKIYNICMILVQSIITVVAPRMIYIYAQKDKSIFLEKLKKYMGIGEYFSCSLASMIFIFGEKMIPFYYGKGFEEVVILLDGFMLILILSSVSVSIETLYLVPIGLQKISSCIVVIGALIDIIADCLLIPRYFAQGAVMATIITEFFLVISFLFCLAIHEKKIIGKIFYDIILNIVLFSVITFICKVVLNILENGRVSFIFIALIYIVFLLIKGAALVKNVNKN